MDERNGIGDTESWVTQRSRTAETRPTELHSRTVRDNHHSNLELTFFFSSDYMASIDEEKKNAVRRMESEKTALKFENDYLKKKVNELRGPSMSFETR